MNVAIRIVDNSGQEIVIAIGSRAGIIDRELFNRPMVVATIVGLLAAIGLSLLVSQQLGKRIDALSDAAGAVAGGDFSARVEIGGSDEVAQLAESFNDMAAELADAQRRERDFLMSVGHDLRTPLTTIRGYAEALDAGRVDEDRMPRVAAVLHAQAQRLARLIEDLMLLSRLEAREFTMRYEPVDLTAHLAEAVDVLVTRAEPLDIAIKSDLAELPVGETDPDRISQIVGNLFDNALRYSPEGGTIRVSLTRPEEHSARISVSDNGPGIDSEDLPHVFERLYVAQRYQAVRPEGSGLGLAIVAQLVDALGGAVQVESELGNGTTVHVTLPWRE
ncbi:MAG TPA: HAMP domain-containing histidine kinase [Actinobacteria bacterium]|nr:HAMP domain-containing histidine kinase [Actinomycetota bacterium]